MWRFGNTVRGTGQYEAEDHEREEEDGGVSPHVDRFSIVFWGAMCPWRIAMPLLFLQILSPLHGGGNGPLSELPTHGITRQLASLTWAQAHLATVPEAGQGTQQSVARTRGHESSSHEEGWRTTVSMPRSVGRL